MSQLQSITSKRLNVFFEVLSEIKTLEISTIKQRYSLFADKFDEVLTMVISMRLVELIDGRLRLVPRMKRFIDSYGQYESMARNEFVLNELLSLTEDRGQGMGEFLSQFKLNENRYECKLSTEARLKYSDVRNLLMELDFLNIDSDTGVYFIDKKYLMDCLEVKAEKNKITLDELKLKLALKQEIGDEAEKVILEHERKRLVPFPELLSRVTQISKDDVMAGYDILSFEAPLAGGKQAVERHIEVKAVSRFNTKFYWTRNEIETAKRYGDRYFLYLLPVGQDKFYLSELQVFQDPYNQVYNNQSQWARECETLILTRK